MASLPNYSSAQSDALYGGSQFGSPTTATPTAPATMGVQAKAPTVVKKTNTIAPSQTALKDLSGTYANVNGTIYNKASGTKFSNPNDFFKDSGVNSFSNLKFDTAYKPTGSETIYGATPAPTVAGGTSGTPQLTTLSTPSNTSSIITPPAPSTPYTPPNQGTTGVSQGGIIGNLLNFAQKESPEVTKAREDLKNLETDYGQQNADILSRPEGLTQQTGQQGILANLFATKQAAYQTALANALSSQSQQIGATSSAGQLNAPIVNPQTNGLVSPSSNTTVGATTSGANNLNALVGSRSNMDKYGIGTQLGADGKTTAFVDKVTGKVFPTPQALADFINSKNPQAGATAANVFDLLNTQEFYNKSNNQPFSNPNDLAAFVNQQLGNNNANASNVFDLLKQSGQNTGDVVTADNPLYPTLVTAANLLATNQVDAANKLMGSLTPAVQSQIIRMAQAQGYVPNVAAGAGAAQQSNAAATGTAGTNANISIYQDALKQAADLQQKNADVQSFGRQVLSNLPSGVNPFGIPWANEKISDFLINFGTDPRYVTLATNIQGLQARISALLNTGEIPSAATAGAQAIANGSLDFQGMQATLDQLEREGAALVQNMQNKANTAYNNAVNGNPGTTGSGSSTGGSINSGGDHPSGDSFNFRL